MLARIPGLTTTDPTVPRAVLEAKLKLIDKRRAEIEALLKAMQNPAHRPRPDSFQQQELTTELAALNSARREVETILRPPPKPARSPELQRLYDKQRKADIVFLRSAIKQQTDQAEYAAAALENAGEHRQARLQRSLIPDLPETICREFNKDPALLAEIEDGD